LTTGGREEFKPQKKDVVQLQQENLYPKGQADPDNWLSGNQRPDNWSYTSYNKTNQMH